MKVIKDIYYTAVHHEEKKLDLYLPDAEEFDIFVCFHGGGMEHGDKSGYVPNMIDYLVKKGIAVASANYRMYPEAQYPEFIKDAAAAVAWVKSNIDNYGKHKRLFVGGSSAGGYLSMMLCFDKRFLAPHEMSPLDIDAFIHNAGQPTAHFNLLRERGIDSRRVIIDESAPIYHIGTEENYPNMLFIVATNDMENRYEQTMLALSTLKHFGHEEKTALKVMEGYNHCGYDDELDENGESIFGKVIYDYVNSL